MKTRMTLAYYWSLILIFIIIPVILCVISKIRIVIFGSIWSLMFWIIAVSICIWFLFGLVSRIPAVHKFIEKYDK